MKTFEYGDFYKFIVSIGIVLISLAVLFPWLLLQEPFGITLKSSEITELTPVAQSIITTRQTTVLWLLRNFYYISGLLALAGSLFLGLGLHKWNQMQKIRDKRESYETEKARRELEPMSAQQIAQKALVDVVEKDTEAGQLAENQTIPEVLVSSPNAVSQYFRIENMVQDKLRSCFSGDGFILPNQRIKSAEYDVVFVSAKENLSDIIFEIKYAKKGFRSNWVRESVNRLILATDVYNQTTGRNAINVIFFISPKDTLSQISTEKYKNQVTEEVEKLGAKSRILFIPEEDWESLDCKELRTMISI